MVPSVSRVQLLSDDQRALTEDLLPARTGKQGRPFSDARSMVEGIIYRGRNVVERRFTLLEQWRGLATRYDKLAIVHRSAVVLHAAITWSGWAGS
ncbi:transposase [Amycolatopsis sp. CA-128772]|uniref:transposase n=1 Tax=Amycolatopsis sp. CA-128772 TaxID=2073159 RepID=UPI00351A9B8C